MPFPEFKRRYFGEALGARNPLKFLDEKGYAPSVRDKEFEAMGYADFMTRRRIKDEDLETIRSRGARITEIKANIPKI